MSQPRLRNTQNRSFEVPGCPGIGSYDARAACLLGDEVDYLVFYLPSVPAVRARGRTLFGAVRITKATMFLGVFQ